MLLQVDEELLSPVHLLLLRCVWVWLAGAGLDMLACAEEEGFEVGCVPAALHEAAKEQGDEVDEFLAAGVLDEVAADEAEDGTLDAARGCGMTLVEGTGTGSWLFGRS